MIKFTFNQKGMTSPEKPRTRSKLLVRVSFKLKHADGPFSVRRNRGKFVDNLSLKETMDAVRAHTLDVKKAGLRIDIRGQGQLDVFNIKAVEVVEYVNPFRFANITPARIDAGVDYCGSGNVTPFGRARILQRGVPSHNTTFGNSLSSYVLLDGWAAGVPVFFAEHYNLALNASPGDTVDENTILYNMNGCIEIGVATADGRGSKEWNEMGYKETQLGVLGKWMSDFLVSTGAPAGLVLGRPVVGTLPPGWPKIGGV